MSQARSWRVWQPYSWHEQNQGGSLDPLARRQNAHRKYTLLAPMSTVTSQMAKDSANHRLGTTVDFYIGCPVVASGISMLDVREELCSS